MSDMRPVPLKLLSPLMAGYAVNAPPAFCARATGLRFECARCGIALLQAEQGQIYNIVIRCRACGTYNSKN